MDVQCRRFAFGLRTFPRTSGVDSRRGHLDDTRLGSLDSLCVAGQRFLLFNHSGACRWNHRRTYRAAPGAHGSDSLDLRVCLVSVYANRLTLYYFARVERQRGAPDSTGMGKQFQQLLEILDRDERNSRRGALGDRTCAFVDLAVTEPRAIATDHFSFFICHSRLCSCVDDADDDALDVDLFVLNINRRVIII